MSFVAQSMEAAASGRANRTKITIGLCFIVALLEGLDLQAPGIAGPSMATAFALDKAWMGWIFGAGILGLLPGALIGGRLADRIGRKWVLIAAVILFGVFSIATACAWDAISLLIARLMTGVGLGAALPNLIALSSEAAGPRHRGTAVSLMYCGVPLGASLAALIGLGGFESGWKTVFYVGGLAPLLVAPLLAFWLPESEAFSERQRLLNSQDDSVASTPSLWHGLFKEGAALPTLLLWVAYFFTLMVVYMLINWLPSLIIGQGFTPNQANFVMFSLQIGATLGTLVLGALMDRLHPLLMTGLTYLGILASLAALGMAFNINMMLGAGFIAGFFTVGGQLVLYALAPLFYQTAVRASGVGSAVAVGRLGAMTGPLVAGQMLATGAGATGVMLASTPGILLAAVAVSYLLVQRRRQEFALN